MSDDWGRSTAPGGGDGWQRTDSNLHRPPQQQSTPFHPSSTSHQQDELDQRFGNVRLNDPSGVLPSPAKNFSAFGGGLFFSQQQEPISLRGFQSNQPLGMHQHSTDSHQQQHEQQHSFHPSNDGAHSQAHTQQLHQQPPVGAGKSIYNEVMSMMHQGLSSNSSLQPNQHSQGPSQTPMHLPTPHSSSFPAQSFPPSFPPSAFPGQPGPAQPVGPAGLRPPMRQGPPGFKAPPGFAGGPPPGLGGGPVGFQPGFPHQQQNMPQQHQQPTPQQNVGASNQQFPGPSPLPTPLQNDSHVQCSLCRVIVVNNPQSLFAHDHSPQHIENERRARMGVPMQGQPVQGPGHEQHANPSPPLQPQSQPQGTPAGLPPGIDIGHLQAQLRAYMIASEQAKAAGQQPAPMDPVLIAQLKQVQDSIQRNGVSPGPTTGPDESKTAKPASASSSNPQVTGVPSTAGPFPSRAALIQASSVAPIIPLKKLNFKRGPAFLVPLNLEFDLEALLQTLQADPSTFQVREEIRSSCEKLIQQIFGAGSEEKISVKLFGSSVNSLCETKSDVDLCLVIKDLERVMEKTQLTKSIIVDKIGELFKPYFTEILALPKARVPIVKFVAPKYQLHCDLGINNFLAVKNSELIRDYMLIDPRARSMCLLVKHWARARKINDPYRGTLSSYCYVMMVIQYLQNPLHVHPPVLPCLQTYGRQDTSPEEIEAAKIDGLDCWYYKDIEKLKNFGQGNQQTLGELLIGFFRLYSHEYDFKECVVSVRTAAYLEKRKKVWAESGKKDRQLLCVEDPFDVTHNLSRGCDATALYEIRGEFLRAFRMLVNEGASIYSVMEPYTKEFRGA